MDRQVVTKSRLLEILSEELRQSTGCKDAKIVGKLWPLKRGPAGRNWELDPEITYEYWLGLPTTEQVRRVVSRAYKRYNIEWWDPS